MLPGLRFLFIAILLSVSVLIFGLGAASLMRAAHQEFVSVPSRPRAAEPIFAAPGNTAMPSLALLRVDPLSEATEPLPVPPQEATAPVTPAENPAVEPPAIALTAASPSAEIDPPAPPLAAAIEQNPPEIAQSETIVRNEPGPAAEARSPAEPKVAATEAVPLPAADQPATAPAEPSVDPAPATELTSTKIATLGGPPVEIEALAAPARQRTKSHASEAKKKLRAERAARRKQARRAAALRASRTPADPFAQPFGGFPGAVPRAQ